MFWIDYLLSISGEDSIREENLSKNDKRQEKHFEMTARIEIPMIIPSVPPTELMSPRKSNRTYSSYLNTTYGAEK